MKLNLFLSGISDKKSYDLQATFGFQEKHRQGWASEQLWIQYVP